MENLNNKYKPKNINQCLISDKNKKILNKWVENKYCSNTIFYGSIGTGKSTIINILLNNLDNVSVFYIDTLCNQIYYYIDNKKIINNIDIKLLFNELENIIKKKIYKNQKIIFVIINFNLLKQRIQNNFSVLYHKYNERINIIIETDNLIDISNKIQNDMWIIKIDNISKENYYDFIKNICEKENVLITDEVLEQLYIITNGDIRNTLNRLTALIMIIREEEYKEINIKLFEKIFSIPSSISIHKIINSIIEGNDESVINECDKLINDKFDSNEIMCKLFDEIIKEPINEDDKHLILEKLGMQIYQLNKYQENINLKEYLIDILNLFK